MKNILILSVLLLAGLTQHAQSFYELNTVQTIQIVFTQSNWDQLLDAEAAGAGNFIMAQSITINGTLAPTNATLTVFPGAYVIASGLPEVSLPKEPVLADALGQAFEITLAPTLTPAGEQRLVTLAKQSLAQCLKEKKLAPSGCPNAVAPAAGQTMSEKTITWTLVGNPWKKPTYEVSAAQPTVATGRSRFTFRLRGSLKQGSLTFTVDQELPYVVSFQADLTNVTGPVTWTRQ